MSLLLYNICLYICDSPSVVETFLMYHHNQYIYIYNSLRDGIHVCYKNISVMLRERGISIYVYIYIYMDLQMVVLARHFLKWLRPWWLKSAAHTVSKCVNISTLFFVALCIFMVRGSLYLSRAPLRAYVLLRCTLSSCTFVLDHIESTLFALCTYCIHASSHRTQCYFYSPLYLGGDSSCMTKMYLHV